MAEYICTITAREYRDLVSETARVFFERQEHRRVVAELAAVKVELDETKKALAAKTADCELWYNAYRRVHGESKQEAQSVGVQ